MLHSQIGCRQEVDSRLLVVGPSFAHNLVCRCPNGQYEAIFDIYASRPFQWHQEHLNARCFGPFCGTLNIREFRRTPNPPTLEVLGFTPTLGQSGVATLVVNKASTIEVTIMQMGQFIYQIVIDIITHVYNYVHGTDYHKMIKTGEGKKKKSLTRRQSLQLHKVFLNCERRNTTLTL